LSIWHDNLIISLKPAVNCNMGQCVSVVLDSEGMRQRIQQLEQQLEAGGGGGGGAATVAAGGVPAGAVAAVGHEVLFFPDSAM
jgi:hypothetical protein